MVKLVGYINGEEVKFYYYPPSKYSAVIPTNIHGKYIIQVKVINAAGNELDFSDTLYLQLDIDAMSFRILPYGIYVIKNPSKLVATTCNTVTTLPRPLVTGYNNREFKSNYSYRELVGI